jgi:hypothetical protein
MFLGFIGMKDLFCTIIAIKSKEQGIVAVISGIIGTFVSFSQDWIFDDSKTLAFVFLILITDWITGMVRGIKSEEGFKTAKALRIFPIITIHTIMLSTINHFLGGTAAYAFSFAVISVTIVSVLKNAVVLRWVDSDLAHRVLENIDKHKKIK